LFLVWRVAQSLGIEKLSRVFNPKTIAVIGASEREGSIGAKILQNLTRASFAGEVFPVNPFRQTVQGLRAYPRVSSIPVPVDLAIVATPASTVPSIIEDCGVSGVAGAVIVSAGLKERTEHGDNLEAQISEHQKKYGLRIIGTHSFGIIRPKNNLFATFAEKRASLGKIAFISQSAALCAAALDWAWEAQVGFSAVVSTGSMLDVDMGDLVDFFGLDSETRSIMLYMESLKNPRKFMSAARELARDKPIVVVKAGRFRESREAALSHSGALAGEDAIYDAAFKRAGIVRVKGISELFDCAEALTTQPKPLGTSLTIITNAGGPAILATDRLLARGGKLAQLSSETVQELKTVLPFYCSIGNPIDIYEEAPADRFRRTLEICLKDSRSHGFLVLYTPQGATDPLSLAATIIDLAKQATKPILTCLMSQDDRCREARRVLQKAGIPSFTMPEEAVSTFIYMHNYALNLELLYQTPEEIHFAQTHQAQLRALLRRAFCEGRSFLSLPESMRFLDEYRIPAVKTVVAKTAEEAEALSAQLGYPIVMKALSPQVSHKSKIQGVILNIWSPSELKNFFDDLANKVETYSETAEFQGVAIQPMVREKGWELLLGSKNDPQFGPVILFGTGGRATEAFNDVSIGFPPLNQVLARRLIEETTIFKRAASFRQAFDEKLVEDILVKFSKLVSDFPEIASIDINPLIAGPENAVAVDTRVVINRDRLMREVAEHRESSLIAAYPTKYITTRTLKNGEQVLLRPIKAEDEDCFNELIKSLSPESMRFRFFSLIKEMPHETLARYCNLDYDRQIAIVAELQGRHQIIGAGRVIVQPNRKSGEFAVLVTDKWQRLGLGSLLMDYIIDFSRDTRLAGIFAHVLPNNYKMLKLCEKKGFKTEILDEETVKASLVLS
jgi:acetyltransferase